jgi:hypothetical protein
LGVLRENVFSYAENVDVFLDFQFKLHVSAPCKESLT